MSVLNPTAMTPAHQAAQNLNPAERLADILWAHISERDLCSFVELQRAAAEAGFPAIGTRSLVFDSDRNLVLWTGLSDVLPGAIVKLLYEQRVFMEPASWWSYLADGTVLALPVAKRPPRGGYRHRHWLPVVFRTVPF